MADVKLATMEDVDSILEELGVRVPKGATTRISETPTGVAGVEGGIQALEGYTPAVVPPETNWFIRGGKNILMGLGSGVASEAEALDSLAGLFAKVTGIDKPTALAQFAEWAKPTEEELAAGGEGLGDKVLRAFGAAVPAIATFIGPTMGIGAALKAAKLPTVLKLGQTAFTGGQRLLKGGEFAQAGARAALAGKKLKGVIPLAEPLAFAGVEAGHEALRPEATLGGTLGAGLQGLLMGTALPLARGLSPLLQPLAGAGIFAAPTAMEPGATAEDVLTSGIVGAGLIGLPTIIKGAKGAKRLILGKEPTIRETLAKQRVDVSEEAKTSTDPMLASLLKNIGYENSELWTNYQKQMVLTHSFKPEKPGAKPTLLDIEFTPTTKDMKIRFGDYTVDIPKVDPKARKIEPSPEITPTVVPTEIKPPIITERYQPLEPEALEQQLARMWEKGTPGTPQHQLLDQISSLYKGTIKPTAHPKINFAKMTDDELRKFVLEGVASRELKIRAEVEVRKRIQKENQISKEAALKKEPFAVEFEIYKNRCPQKTLDPAVATSMIQDGYLNAENIEGFLQYLISKDYKIKPLEVNLATMGDVEAALAETTKAREAEIIPPTVPKAKAAPPITPEIPKAGALGLREQALFINTVTTYKNIEELPITFNADMATRILDPTLLRQFINAEIGPKDLLTAYNVTIEKGGPPYIAGETVLEKQKRMRKWADKWLEEKGIEEKEGGPLISSPEGIRVLQKEAITGIIKRTAKAGRAYTVQGGIKGRLPKEGEEISKRGEEALSKILATEKGGPPPGPPVKFDFRDKDLNPRNSTEAWQLGKLLDREQGKELWKRYIADDEKIRGLPHTKERAQKAIENQLKKEMVESHLDPSPTDTRKGMTNAQINEQLGLLDKTKLPPGARVLLVKRDGPNAINFLTPEDRAKLIDEINRTLRWNRNKLQEMDDGSLQKIASNNISVERAWIPEVKRKKYPDALAEAIVPPKTEKAGAERARDQLQYPEAVINAVDWERVEKLRKEGILFEKEAIGEEGARVSIERIVEGEEGIGEAMLPAEAPTGVDPAKLVGFMLKGVKYPEALRLYYKGASIPTYDPSIYKGYEKKPKLPKRIPDEELKNWFESELIATNKGIMPSNDLGRAAELDLIFKTLPGLKGEMLGDPEYAPTVLKLRNWITGRFNKYREKKSFIEAAKDAFADSWKGMKYEPEATKTRLFGEVGRILEETEVPEVESLAQRLKAPGGAPTPTGAPTYDEMMARLPKIDKGPLNEIDEMVAKGAKLLDPLKNYRNMMDLYAKNARDLQESAKKITGLKADQDAATDSIVKKALTDQIGTLQDRVRQRLVDNEYYSVLRDYFTRTGKPFTAGEVYLEGNLNTREHGIDGSIISQARPKGSTFYVVQGPEGGIAKPGEPGHKAMAKVEVVTRRTRGDISIWDVPEGMNPAMEDALYKSILDRYMWRDQPISITNLKGVAEAVAARREDKKYELYKQRPDIDIMKWIPEDRAYAAKVKAALHESLQREAREAEVKAPYGKYTKEKRDILLQRCQSLKDSTIDVDLNIIYKTPEEMGIVDPKFNYSRLEYIPLMDRIGDPTQSRVLPVARVGNLAQQADLQIKHHVMQYVNMAEGLLGPIRYDEAMKRRISQHLRWAEAKENPEMKQKFASWESKDPEVIKYAQGYRTIMDSMADFFELEKKGLYHKAYATISYDLNEIWNKYRKKLQVAEKPSELPDAMLAKIDPKWFYELKRIAEVDKKYDNLDSSDRAAVMEHFFKWNLAYDKWENMPERTRAMIPKVKFNVHFQRRTADDIMAFALKEDLWEVMMRYIYSTVHDGIMTDFFLPKSRSIVANIPDIGVGSTATVRGYLDSYIKQVAGFGRDTSTAKMLENWAQKLNALVGKPILPEAGMAGEAASIYTSWLYRGALGVDTAIRNLTQSIYTLAETGPSNFLKGVIGYVGGVAKKTEPYKEFRYRMSLTEEFFDEKAKAFKKTFPGKKEAWRDMDRRLTALALSPMRLTEHVNRGIAYFAGLAEAQKLGLDFKTAHVVGMKSAVSFIHPLEMSEAEWFAMRKMYATQFGYGATHTSPMMYGTLMKFLTPFWSFPTKTMQFWANMAKGITKTERLGELAQEVIKPEDSWFLSDRTGQAKTARFLALTGFLALAPQLLSTLGIDAGYLWGKGLFPNNFSPMWLNMMNDFYVGYLGGMGMDVPPTEADKTRAYRNFNNSLFMFFVPQYRYGRKIAKSVENMEKGYYTMGPSELPAYETTFAKEFINMMGFPPDTKEAKQLVWDAYRERGDTLYLKQDTLREAAKYYEKGDVAKAAALINKLYGEKKIRIHEFEIRDFIRRQNTVSAFEEAEKHILHEMKGEWAGKLRGAEEKYLPYGTVRKYGRSFWTNPQKESLTEMLGEEE